MPFEAWYKNTVLGEPHIYIGFYHKSGGAVGEFKIEWNKIGIQLQAFDDSWEVLSSMPELIKLMAKISKEKLEPTITEFAEMLKGIGFKDITERERAGKE